MTLALEVVPDSAAAATRVASLVSERAQESVARSGSFTLALSKAPRQMLDALVAGDVPWSAMSIFQVDERIAPAGHEDRNLIALSAGLPPEAKASLRPMPVEEANFEAAAGRYAAGLPAHLDLVHLGLGPDGHTASLVPGDPVLEIRDRLVAITREYQGRRRMTLTYPALAAAREIVWLVTGDTKRDALERLLAGDTSIPAVRIFNPRQLVIADEAAMSSS